MTSASMPQNLCKNLASRLATILVVTCLWPIASVPAVAAIVTECTFQSARPTKPAVAFPARLDTADPAPAPPVIDGKLDDNCWQHATLLHLQPDSGSKQAARPTRVRICYDAGNLYLGLECVEPDLVEYWPLEDPESQWAEQVRFCLAPDQPQAPEIRISVNPRDNATTWNSTQGHAWKPEWRVKTALMPKGWVAEIALPFAALGVKTPAAGALWRANLYRHSILTGEESAWEPTLGNQNYTPLWGKLFFGPTADYTDRLPPILIHAWPERRILLPGDKTLRLLARLEPGKTSLTNTRLRLLTSRNQETDDTFESLTPEFAAPAQGERVLLTLDPAALPTGPFHLHIDLLGAEDQLLARARVALTKSAEEPAPRAKAQLKLLVLPTGVASETGKKWPIQTGVALPRGALFNPARARVLNQSGTEIPAQAQPRSIWPDGSIRWLSLDFRADVTADKPHALTLEYGPGVTRKSFKGFSREEPHLPFHVVEKNWMVNTGQILFTINTERFTGIQSVWVDVDGNDHFDWQEYILNKERSGRGPYLKDVDGNTYAFGPGSDLNVRLEEWNELRLELRAEGDLVLVQHGRPPPNREEAEPPPPKLGRSIVRITAYAGQPIVRIRYTFLLTRLAANAVLSDIGVEERFEYDFGKRLHTLFGVPGSKLLPLRQTQDVFMIWAASDGYAVRSEKGRPPINLSGTEAENWTCAHSENRGVALCLRDMNMLFPKAFEMVATNALLRVHFWPPQQDQLIRELRTQKRKRTLGELDFAHYYHLLDLRVPASFGVAGDKSRGTAPRDEPHRYRSDPTGIALTYDTLYYFYRGDCAPAEISAVAKTFELNPHAIQDRASLAAARVLPGILSPTQAQTALAAAKQLLQLEARAPEYGDMNFLDLHRQWDPATACWTRNYSWLGTSADMPAALWQLYLQTGDLQILRTAQRNLRHILGLGFCHLTSPEQSTRQDPRDRKIAGAFGRHRTPIHWQETVHVSDRHARLRAPLLAWYLTGDTVAYDAALLWRQAAIEHGAPDSGENGAVFIDNLWAILQLQYDPLVHEKLGACVDFFSRRPCESADIHSWPIGLGLYARESGDTAVWQPLKRLAANDEQLEACAQDFALLGLLRDLDLAAGKPLFHDAEGPRALAAFEQRTKNALTLAPPDDGALTWLDLCSYILAAGAPAPAPEPAAE